MAIFLIFVLLISLLTGCATKMVYLNRQKTTEAIQKDKTDCDAEVNTSDFKDPSLKEKKFNQCMQEKGYKVVSEDEAEKIQGFQGLWVKTGIDFKAYEVIFIDKVDVSQVKVKNTGIPDSKVTSQDINNLGEQMLERFSKALNVVMPVIKDQEKAAGKKVLNVSLKLISIAQTNVGLNAALQVAGHFTPIPLPGGPEGIFSFEGEIADYSSKEKLITISDETKADKNAPMIGLEDFDRWKRAYNIMEYWADHLAALLAKERGQEYKSQPTFKLF